MISILICDDHPLILHGVTALLAGDKGFRVAANVRDGHEALSQIQTNPPDIALLDVTIPPPDGLTLLKTIGQQRLPVRVVLLTATITDEQVLSAVTAGVAGIVLKESASETLLHCLKLVAQGGRWLPRDLIQGALNRRGAAKRSVSPLSVLTPREMQVAMHIAEGASNREVAGSLSMTEGTVKIHLHNIYAKLDVDNRTALAIMVMRNGTTHVAPSG